MIVKVAQGLSLINFDLINFSPWAEDFLPHVAKFELQPLVLNPESRSFLNNCLDQLSQNSRNSFNWNPSAFKREDSPEFIELEAQIEQLR